MSEPPGVTKRSDDQLSLSGERDFDFAMIMQAIIQGQLADVPNVNVDLSAVKAFDAASKLDVKMTKDGDQLLISKAYLAPGDIEIISRRVPS
ncbi:MAG: hypothetical protein V3V10_08165 [Planctomycetota bacterium]